MTFDELKEKALSLPYAPGVYIMRDKTDKVIYVGKAKKLKNRVSQYFQDTASHTPKTRLMVSKIHHFDVIVAASEFEALVLECSLIKRYMPKYNILLKDDKGYPCLRLNMKDIYPVITMVSKPADDGADYYGPYGGRAVTHDVMEAIRLTLKLPGCHKQFPRDIGKERPCLNYHMNQCAGWCQENKSCTEYRETMLQARELLKGNYKAVAEQLRGQMLSAADNLEFELAASLRDRLNAVENLGQKQLVTAGTLADTDVVGYGETEAKACFAVLHFSGGNLLDKDYEVFSRPDDKLEAVSSLLKQFYLSRGIAPKRVLLPFEIDDGELFAELLEQQYGRRPKLHVPQRGEKAELPAMAQRNAREDVERVTTAQERENRTLTQLAGMLSLPEPPERMESYDISNTGASDIVASMVVYEGAKPKKSAYRRFKIKSLSAHPDDYASMEEVLTRRIQRYLDGDEKFSPLPDVMLIDGGITHAGVAERVCAQMHVRVPIFGMVKDDRHRTRALVTAQGREIDLHAAPNVFALIGQIQDETHRFAITFHHESHSRSSTRSALDGIPGIGKVRAQALLKTFKSVKAIREADIFALERVLPKDAAASVYLHFHGETDEKKDEM